MASKFILIVKDGGITKVAVRKPPAPRDIYKWLGGCAAVALQSRARHYVFWHAKQWHVYGVDYPHPVKSFAAEHQAAAEMYLIAHVGRTQ